jgi:hypothetical protein
MEIDGIAFAAFLAAHLLAAVALTVRRQGWDRGGMRPRPAREPACAGAGGSPIISVRSISIVGSVQPLIP